MRIYAYFVNCKWRYKQKNVVRKIYDEHVVGPSKTNVGRKKTYVFFPRTYMREKEVLKKENKANTICIHV